VYQLFILARGHSRIRLRWTDLAIVPDVLLSLIRVSVTGVLQFAIGQTSWVLLVRLISEFGSLAVAGYTIGIRIFIFAVLPSWGLSGAAATMVGQNLGAGKPDRAERAVWLTGAYNAVFLAVVAVAFIAFPQPIVSLFSSDPGVLRYGVDCLRVIAYGNVAYAFGMVMVQAFNGAADTITPTLINLIGFWMCEIPLAYALAFATGMGVHGVFAAIPISEALITVMGLAMFVRGRWRTRRI
jgi:Na+-driven multidrug efflux pump